MLYVIYCVHGWRWAILSARVEVGFSVLCYNLCYILSARVEVGFSDLCYMLYTVFTGGGGLY